MLTKYNFLRINKNKMVFALEISYLVVLIAITPFIQNLLSE